MEFKRRWLGYDRQQVQSLLEQTTEANNAALENARQLLAMLEGEKDELEAQLQHLQLRLAMARSRAERLEESSYIVDSVFEIMKEALTAQRGEIQLIARQMAGELLQRCSQLQSEANDMDAAIAIMQKQIDERQHQYHDILSGNGQEIARINEKYQQLLQARKAMGGEINEPQVPDGLPASELISPSEGEKPALQLVASNRREADTTQAADSSLETAPVAELEKPAAEPVPEGENPPVASAGSDSVSA